MNETQSTEEQINQLLKVIKNNCTSVVGEVQEGLFCRGGFDRLYCWPDTPAGILAKQPCANDYIKPTNEDKYITKQCTVNGTWYQPENGTDTWTHIWEACGLISIVEPTGDVIDPIYEQWLPIIKIVSYVGYTLSIVASIIALIIFINIKRLHCERNKLHINLFVSFIARALLFLLKDALFVNGTSMLFEMVYVEGEPKYSSSWICKAFISVRHYFIIANFTLMMMEGLYLHNLIFLNLFSDNHATTLYCVFGWVIPLIFIIPWVILRILYENTLCWTRNEEQYVIFIQLPIGISVLINFMLFLIIVRTLVMKLNFNSTFIQQRRIRYSKLLRSTLILIPIFGIPYVLSLFTSFYVQQNKILELMWILFDQWFSAFQGLFAALLYCLLNSDVQLEVRRKYSSLRDLNNKEFRRSRTISNNTQQSSLQVNDEALENLNIFGISDDSNIKRKDQEASF